MKNKNFLVALAIAAVAIGASSQTISKKKANSSLPTQLPGAPTQTHVTVDFTNDTSAPSVVIVNPTQDSDAPPQSVDQALAKSQTDLAAQKPKKTLRTASKRSSHLNTAQAAATPAPTPAPEILAPLLPKQQVANPPAAPVYLPSIPPPTEQPVVVEESALTVNPSRNETPFTVSETSAEHLESKSSNTQSKRRLDLRTSYLDAHYDQVVGDLQNGATTMGIALSFEHSWLETQYAIDFVNGLDQTLSPANTRTTVLHFDGKHKFAQSGQASWLAGMGIGASDVALRSYRTTPSGGIILEEHARGTFLTLIPSTGMRFNAGEYSIDVMLQYLAMVGSGQASALGGLSAGLSFGIPF